MKSGVLTWQMALACTLFAVFLAGGQVLFKLAAEDMKDRFRLSWFDTLLSPWLLAAVALYVASTALWLIILTQMPLTKAYPFALLGAAIVPLLARVTLGEALSPQYLLGLAVAIGGIALIQLT
ncbi:MAG: hypothetical protein HY834_09335 [Devosia nanyangense]|uniref:EamA domain-containing protein n=1 Tax=Devosia nanyangense TaxID=1228055 RepID=A0A933NYP3_9HYPH|nr:hypothetical protein [Devosia nanyangense]